MVEERWNNHNGLDEPPPNPLTNGIKPLPISQIRIPKIVRPGPSSDANPPSRDQDIADREQLRNQLTSLQALLEKTSKKGGDLIRNFRGRDVNQCPQYAENLKLQQDVEKRIEEVKGKLFEVSRRLGANKEEEKKEEKKVETIDVSISKPFVGAPITDEDEDISFKVFNDPGCHWCKQCDIFVSDLGAYLQHLQSDKHWRACETKEEPWRKSQIKPKIELDVKKIAVEIKGTHTLMPVRGYFCQVCGVLLGSQGHAEDHLKTNKHNRCFNRHVLMNGTVELNYSVSKSRSLSKMQKLDAKRQREQEEKEEREKESKKRAIEAEIKKRMTEEKDKENRSKKNRESSEKESKTSREDDRDRKVIRDRERDRERSREKDRDRDRERERDRDRDREKDREREKTKNSLHKSSSHSRDKIKERVKEREREREKEREHKNKLKRHDDSKKTDKPNKSSTTIIEPVDENVFGPHFPFRDRKLAMKPIVHIPKNEWQLCWKKHMKLMMKGKLPTFSGKLEQESVQKSEPEEIQKPLSPPTPSPQPQISTEADMEAVDSSIGDLVLSINYDKDLSDNEFDKDNDINLNSTVSLANDMFTVEFDDESERADKMRGESDFVVSQDNDFPRFEPLVINNGEEDEPFSSSVTDTPMLSPPMWVQPLSLHDLAE